MSFRDPHQQHHKIQGMKAAAMSPRTPAHLRQHIHKKIKEHESMAPKHNATTLAGTHGKGGKLSPVKLPGKNAAAAPQPPKTASANNGSDYSGFHPARAAELMSTSNTSEDAQKLIAAPPMPFKTQASVGESMPGSVNQTGPDQKPTAGLSGKNDGGPIESQARPVASGPKAVP
ncbi:MAG TPA: hypothetical protein VKU42_14600, partial [Candidatus Angelobacter sp.]|nr:hypothetical protein [Candidatus Angelobacter sp.]